ncbi:DUF2254 domain-containing protein [Streptomyces sp. NPDC093252]|uniref:DUF2254 domain-containing protein n=1 Tax=Streptomyces sp. NPDC093252 TaxID=3154980 RepID=UPI00341B845C
MRTRYPRRGRGSQRRRRMRSLGLALFLVVAGALLGWALPRWEEHLPNAELDFDASTAQATLAAIAGGMITLAGFIITAITLVIQTVQSMSPRLVSALGHFSRYLVLFGLLIGTALYALVALSDVRGDNVPRTSVTLAVCLVLIDAVTVLLLIGALRHAVTGGGLARSVGDRLRVVIEETSPTTPPVTAVPGLAPPDGDRTVPVPYGGGPAVLQAVKEPRLARLAARHDIRVRLSQGVGDFVGTGTVVARVEGVGGRPVSGRLARRVAACLRHGPGRTVEQDPGYGLRLLADIAVRALSPAVNDPTTAVQALDQIEDGLLRLAGRPLGPAWLLDRAGRPRVLCPASDWPGLVSLALDETLLYGAGNPQVARRLHALLDRVLAAAPAERRAPLLERREALRRLTAAGLPDPLLNEVAGRSDHQGLGGRRG